MNKYFISLIASLIYSINAYAYTCTEISCNSNMDHYVTKVKESVLTTGVTSTGTACGGTVTQKCYTYTSNGTTYMQPIETYSDCGSCNSNTSVSSICSNVTRVASCGTVGGGGSGPTIDPDIFKNCDIVIGSECSTCTPATAWTSSGTTSALSRYEERTVPTCTADTDCKCEYTTERRCAANSYGTPSCSIKQSTGIQCSGCSGCPYQDGIAGSSNAGSTAITDCYIKAGSTGTTSNNDKYSISQQCNYSN